MASYEASIKVLVEAQQAFRAVKELENRLKNIQDKAAKAQIKGVITESAQDVRRAERRLKAQIDLNAATELYQRRLTQINRAGGARNAQQREELAGLAQIIQSQGDNARIVQKVATATGRILEVIRETNRTDKRSNELQSQVRAYQKQFDLLAAQGASQSKLNELAALRDKLSGQQSRKELDLAAITKDQLDRKLKLLTTEIKIKQAAEATAAAERSKLQQQGLALRRLARGVDPLISRAGAINAPAGQLALPSSKLLGAEARGLQRIETSEERIARFAQRTAEAKAKSAVRSADIFEANRKAAKAGERNAKAAERAAAAEERTARAVRRTARTRGSGGAGGGRGRGGNVLVGAAFPALFGAGPAGILGGAIGEAFGPLGGVVGSALGAPVDAFVAETIKVGQALNSTSGALELVREKSLFSSDSIKERAAVLEEQGRVEELAALLTDELVSAIGNKGVKALQDLGDTTDETTRLWNQLTLQLSRLVAGPLNDFLAALNTVLGQLTTGFRYQALLEDLSPEQRQQAESKLTQLQGRVGQGRSAAKRQKMSTTEAQKRVIEQFGPLVEKTAAVKINAEDRRTFAVKDKKQAAEAERIAAAAVRLETQLLQERLKQFDLKTRYMALSLDELEALEEANYRLDERANLEMQINDKQRAQALAKDPANEYLINQLYDQRLNTAQGILELARFDNIEKSKGIQLQREITQLQREQETQDIRTDLQRQIATAGLQLSSPFGGDEAERLELRLQQLSRYDDAITSINNKIKIQEKLQTDPKRNVEATKEIENLQKQLEIYKELLPKLDAVEQAQLRQSQILQKYGFIADELSTAMSSVIETLVTGTGTVEEALATMFGNIGKAFIDMATQIIAQQIVMITMQAILRALGGPSFGGGGGLSGGLGGLPATSNVPFNGSMPFTGFADGGTVMPGNTYMVGERGPELLQMNRDGSGQVINNNVLSASMNRYRRPQAANNLDASTATEMQPAALGGAANDRAIDVRYTVERINEVDYVTAEQFRQGMRDAAQQGAKQGEQRTLARLQNAPSVRRRIGI